MSADVSVIIAAYNVERYIERAVRSALDQEGAVVEVIVVDDGSTDATWAAASGIGDARLKCIRLPRNGGPSHARNAGMAAATGAWIAVLDGDDAFGPGRLARCMERAQGVKADIVTDNLTVRREADGAVFPMFAPEKFARHNILNLADFIAGNSNFFSGYGLGYLKPVFSSVFLKRHGLSYDSGIRIGEDYLLLAEALAVGAVCAVEQTAGYLYTARAGSISHRLVPADLDRISACDEKFLSRHPLDTAAAQAQKKRSFGIHEARAFALLVDAIKRKSPRDALRALSACPTAARHLWLPVRARMERCARAFRKDGHGR